jgi:organic radical activating enzyme
LVVNSKGDKLNKYLSIITNFGCHYSCPYCIVKENDLKIPTTTLEGLDNLDAAIRFGNYDMVSVSGGGDPLHNFSKTFNTKWYGKLFKILNDNNIKLEMHTSYIDSIFPYNHCNRVVYHLRHTNQLSQIKRKENEIVRIVYVVDEHMSKEEIEWISGYVANSNDIDELSFRQMVNNKYETTYYNFDFLKWGHDKGYWHYIEQNDYNDYYSEGKIYKNYKDIGIKR